MLLQISDGVLIQAFEHLSPWMTWSILSFIIIAYVLLQIKKDRSDKKTKSLMIEQINLSREIVDTLQDKVRNIQSIDGVKTIIDMSYGKSREEIKILLVDICLRNNIHNPNRKAIIIDRITHTVKNYYNRDNKHLLMFRYKSKRLNEDLVKSIDPQILVDGIIKRLYENKSTTTNPNHYHDYMVKHAEDLKEYIDNCFDKYINSSQQYFELL